MTKYFRASKQELDDATNVIIFNGSYGNSFFEEHQHSAMSWTLHCHEIFIAAI